MFADWIFRLSTNPNISKKFTQIKRIAINITHEEMEFMISQWSIESHTSTTTWGEFCLTIEDIAGLTGFPFFEHSRTIKLPKYVVEVSLDEVGKRKSEALNKAL